MKCKVVGVGKEKDMTSKKGVDFRAYSLYVTHEANDVTGIKAEEVFVTDFNKTVYNSAKLIPIGSNVSIFYDRGGFLDDIVVEK